MGVEKARQKPVVVRSRPRRELIVDRLLVIMRSKRRKDGTLDSPLQRSERRRDPQRTHGKFIKRNERRRIRLAKRHVYNPEYSDCVFSMQSAAEKPLMIIASAAMAYE